MSGFGCRDAALASSTSMTFSLGVRLPRFSDEMANSASLNMPMPWTLLGTFSYCCRGSASNLPHGKLCGAVFSIKKTQQHSKLDGHALCPPPLVGRRRASFFGDRSAPVFGQKALPFYVPHAKKVLERSSINLQLIKTVEGGV